MYNVIGRTICPLRHLNKDSYLLEAKAVLNGYLSITIAFTVVKF